MTSADQFSFTLNGDNGKGVLLIHGLTGIPAEMKFVAKGLQRSGFSVHVPLLAGHAQGKQALVKTGWQDWLESVVIAADKFRTQADEVYVAGICVGGKLGMLAAQRMPDVIKAAAIYSPCFRYDGWNVPFYYPLLSGNTGWLSRIPLLSRINFKETTSIGIKDEKRRRLMSALSAEGVLDEFPGKALVQMYHLGQSLKKQLPHITTPTLILHAEEDDLSHPRNARIISDHIAAPHKLYFIKDSYHMIHVDAHHAQVSQLTAQFFTSKHA